jgi:hypothetical protein
MRRVYADDNWTLQNWWNFTQSGPSVLENNGLFFTDNKLVDMRNYIGTHSLFLELSGELAIDHGYGGIISSDSLHLFIEYLSTTNVKVMKDSLFYSYIAKYDQFLGGWSDASTDWYWEEIPKNDTTDIVVRTPIKQQYLNMLPDCQ